MPRKRFGRRAKPVYDWVSTPESYDTCQNFVVPRSNCDVPQISSFALTSAPVTALDTATSYGMPNLRRQAVAVRGFIWHWFQPWDPSNLTDFSAVVAVHHRIVKAQIDLNGEPMTRYTSSTANLSLGMFNSSDEDFLWEDKRIYRFISPSFFDSIGLTGDGLAHLNQPTIQPQRIDVNVRVRRRLEEEECLFLLTEAQVTDGSAGQSANIPQMLYTTTLRTLMQIPRP